MQPSTKARLLFRDQQWNDRAAVVAPLVLAAVIVAGLLALSIGHRQGNGAGQTHAEQSEAIQRILFRH